MLTKCRHFRLLVLGMTIASSLGCPSTPPKPDGAYADPAALAALLADPSKRPKVDYLVVDVRTPAEYAQAHLPTAVNIPVDRIGTELSAPLDMPIILYCKKGIRSARATEILRKKGFTNTTNFGGLGRWPGHIDRATPGQGQ